MKSKTSLFSKMMVFFSLMVVAFNNGPAVHANNGSRSQANVLQSKVAARSEKVSRAQRLSKVTDETLSNEPVVDGGIMGNEGWYISDVNVLSYKPQDSTISEGNNIALTKLTEDGVHDVTVYDNLGNQAIRIVQIDKTGPEITWTDMQNGQVASGKMFNIWGDTQDPVSLNAEVDISYDNGKTWVTMPIPNIPGKTHVADCGFTFLWDTTEIPNGNYVILARSRDVAGNWSKTISLSVRVEN